METWSEDEARLGLKPIVRRVWSPVGERPLALQKPRYQWLYLFGFVRPATGQAFWLVMPTVSAAVWSIALREFANHIGVGPDKRVLLVIDGAGFHTAHDVEVPDGIHIEYLPAYSPELQPCERLWPLVREPLANRVLEDIEALEEAVCQRCCEIDAIPTHVSKRTDFHWWVDAEFDEAA